MHRTVYLAALARTPCRQQCNRVTQLVTSVGQRIRETHWTLAVRSGHYEAGALQLASGAASMSPVPSTRRCAQRSPIWQPGIAEGDLLVAVAGNPLVSVEVLHHALGAAGDTVNLTIVRGIDERTVEVSFAVA